MMAFTLLLKNGTSCKGFLVKNDLLKERVWKIEDDYVFECDVVEATEDETVLSECSRKLNL